MRGQGRREGKQGGERAWVVEVGKVGSGDPFSYRSTCLAGGGTLPRNTAAHCRWVRRYSNGT